MMFPSLAWSLEKIPSLLPLAESQLSPNTAQWLLTLKALRPEEDASSLGTQFSIENSVFHMPEVNRKHLAGLLHDEGRGEAHLRPSASTHCSYTLGDHVPDISNIGGLSSHFGIGTCSANIVLFSAFEAIVEIKTESHLTLFQKHKEVGSLQLRSMSHSRNCLYMIIF